MAVCKKIRSSDGAPLAGAPSASTPLARKTTDAVFPIVSVNEMEATTEDNADIDLREVYFLIIHFLSGGPCHRACGQLWDELLKHNLLPRRYHAWYSRTGAQSGLKDDDGSSLPLSYIQLAERYPHIKKDHLIKLLQQLLLKSYASSVGMPSTKNVTAADVPTLLGLGDVSLLASEKNKAGKQISQGKHYLSWPHLQANQVHALSLREIGGGFSKHHRAPSIRAACFAIAKPSTLLDRIQIIKKLRGHRNSVYCAIFDRSGQYVITGSDDRLVKIWSLETGFCLSSCRGHEGDITDLAVSSNNALVASASNDFIVRVWRLPDGLPISVLQGHTGAVTAIAFSPRPGCEHHLLSSSDDGTCRIWDARDSHINPRVYVPKPKDTSTGAKANGVKTNDIAQSAGQSGNRILCCAFNANGTIFVTGSSDRLARVWSACRRNGDVPTQPNHELDALSGHENDVNYVQFSGSAVPARSFSTETVKEEHFLKFKNSWFTRDNIVTCSRDGSAIIWVPRSRRSHSRAAHWIRAYHLKVPPPPMSPQLPRGGPRQRLVPTPRGVNMIVWSLDNRFVLAAIMDCRICVWNATNGSLVHSLTGHTKSTYVLDVHPFNPRIAMSAGYDGQTIIWDIWEGVPIRTYAIGDFNLVDGKFSPDGTSIVLSDEVGQIYILATGEGESQKDAKYDQFFLGDYRPLVQDAHGNVLDQETQLCPYQRNIQDLLCDASMIPYPDPYQSMYQQRRLGALGIDWQLHPPSVNLVVGTLDDNNYPILEEHITHFQPAQNEGDRDRWLEQPVELENGMDWEREIDAQTDETGSEYNGTDEYTSEDEQGSLSISCSDESKEEESGRDEESSRTNLRRSKRKKRRAEGIMFTSAGRRVRKEADYGDASLTRVKKHTKSKKIRLVPKARTLSEKLVRPQRLAARNALNMFSRIDDSATDEDEELDERDSQDSESKENSMNNEPQKSSRSGKEKCHEEGEKSQDIEATSKLSENKETNRFVNSEKKIVLRFKLRKLVIPESSKSDSDIQEKTISPSGEVTLKRDEQERVSLDFPDTVSAARFTSEGQFNSADTILRPENCGFDNHNDEENKDSERSGHSQKDHYDDPSSAYGEKEIRWGEVRTRTFKRLRVGDTTELDTNVRAKTRVGRSSAVQADAHDHIESLDVVQPSLSGNNCLEEGKSTFDAAPSETGEACCQNDFICPQPKNSCHVCSFNQVEISTKTSSVFGKRKSNAITEEGFPSKRPRMKRARNSPMNCSNSGSGENWITNNGYILEKSEISTPEEFDNVRNFDRQSEMDETVADNEEAGNIKGKCCNCDEEIEMRQNTFRNSKLCRTRSTAQKPSYLPHEWKPVDESEDEKFSEHDGSVHSCKPAEEIVCGIVTDRDANTSGHCLQEGDCNIGSEYLEYNSGYANRENGLDALTLVEPEMQGGMQNVGYNKGNFFGTNMHAGDNSADIVQNSSNDKVSNFIVKLQPGSTEDGRRTRSKAIKADKNVQEAGSSGKHFSVDDGYACEERQTRLSKHGSEAKGSIDAETKMVSRVSVTRHDRNKKSADSNKERMKGENGNGRLNKNLSWLMLYEMEDGSRYIPQFGDEVAYLRQGHHEFLELSGSQEKGPWKTFRSSIQAVEFCRVVGLDYCTLAGSGETCCKLTLKFIDPKSKVCGKTFRLTLPELTDFPDFIVERNRYDMAVNRNWTNRDKCRVWWRSEDGEGGSWWEGRVISVKPKSAEFPDSPWDRCIVQYKADPSGPHTHSPWELCELFDCDNSGWKLLHIDEQTKMQLLCSINELEQGSYKNEDCYALERLRQISGKSDFCNRTPLPLTFEIIKLRLEKDYYRTLEALKHDLDVIVMNVRSFLGKNTEMVFKLQKLTERLLQGLVNES